MWTILNSPGKTSLTVYLLMIIGGPLIIGLAGCTSGNQSRSARAAQEGPSAPDAPRERLDEDVDRPPTIDSSWLHPVELERVEVRQIDAELAELAGPSFLKEFPDALAVVVYAQEPFDMTPRDSSPVVILNGKPLDNTFLYQQEGPNVLVAFLTSSELIEDINTFEVFWVGNEELTRTLDPLTLTREELGLDR